jgi:trimethylamine--corrinoid protein Co-methyltransferase
MIKGIIKVIDEEGMNKVHDASLKVLEKTGLLIRGDFLLQALADAGCKVDFNKQRVWFKADVVERQIQQQGERYKMVRSSLWYPFCKSLPAQDVAWPDEFVVDYGFTTPAIYDYPEGRYRKPTINDQLDMIKLGNALEAVKAICAPFICSEFDSRIESIETSRLLLLNTHKFGWVSTSSYKEVKYLAEFASLAIEAFRMGDKEYIFKTQPPMFAHAYCTTSPLKLDKHACDVLEEALKYKFPVNFAPMPILGGTTPMTPAGSLVIASAEILGCITAASLIDPEVYYYATIISGEMDMKTTQVCYATPEAILTDAAIHQLFRFKYGIVVNVEPAYLEAKCPGIQAAFMKTYRQMAFSSMVSSSLPIGLLDNGSAFSPTQAMIDLDINRALYKLGQGIKIDDETLCVDLINELEFCEKDAYLTTDHTLKHFRDVIWDTQFFDRSYRKDENYRPREADERILKEADNEWRDLVSKQKTPERDARFREELNRIIKVAEKELLS